MITKEFLNDHFSYTDGNLVVKKKYNRRSKVGSKIGYCAGSYTFARINKTLYPLHRLIWTYHNGETCSLIDHRNRDKKDNRIENLRLATKSQNEANTPHRKTNKLCEKHISIDGNSYRLCIQREKFKLKKRFKKLDDAIEYRDLLVSELDGQYCFN